MKTYKSKSFGAIQEPESLQELIDLVFVARNERVYMWRGQADANWRLDSSAYRRHLADKGVAPSARSLKFYEKYLLEKARHRGFDILGGRKLSDLELLARLQHHGAATRLMDFSRSALVAAYFACEAFPRKTGGLVGLHTDYLGGHEGLTEERTYDEIISKLDGRDHPATWQPTDVSLRIAAQGSQFVYSRLDDGERGSLKVDDSDDALVGIAISPRMKARLLDFLRSACDIHRTSLFPDLDGFALAHGVGSAIFGNERW